MGFGRDRLQALRKLTTLLERGLVEAADGEELIELYAKVFDAQGIVIGQQYGFQPWSTHRDIPPEWPEAHTRLRHEDPAPAFLDANPAGTPFRMASAFRGPVAKREIVHELRHVAGFVDGLVQRFRSPWGDDVFVVVYRQRGQRLVSADEELLARLLYPHLAAALSTRAALAAIEGPTGHAPPSDGHATVSFPSLDVAISRDARRLWQATLGPISGAGWRRIERVITRAALDLREGRPGARSRLVHARIRVELAWAPPAPHESHRVLLLFFRAEEERVPIPAPMAELLSPMQREVVSLAGAGKANREIAGALHVSVETVRTHLAEACRRLGVRRRAELAALLRGSELGGLAD